MNAHATHQKRPWYKRLFSWLPHKPEKPADLSSLIQQALSDAQLDATAAKMMCGILSMSKKQARDIMLPRAQMCVIDIDSTIKTALPIVIDSKHSRFPVIAQNRDEVLGILLAKDLLRAVNENPSLSTPIASLIRPATIVPESKRINILLRDFRQHRQHMAIVLDEYGSVAGLVTIENVLEQIVGNIEDEYDTDEPSHTIKKMPNNHFILPGLTPIAAVNEYFSCQLPTHELDTIGGLVAQQFAHIPTVGEQTTLAPFHVSILAADKKQILQLQLRLDEPMHQS